MEKLSNRAEVMDRYWPDFLEFCISGIVHDSAASYRTEEMNGVNHVRRTYPTIENFWLWYITNGPMGIKHKGLFYNKPRLEYL